MFALVVNIYFEGFPFEGKYVSIGLGRGISAGDIRKPVKHFHKSETKNRFKIYNPLHKTIIDPFESSYLIMSA